MLMTARIQGGQVIECFPGDNRTCRICLSPTPEANQINGKVQLCYKYCVEHYGIVIELEGRITFSRGLSKDVIKVFQPKDSDTVVKSTVFHQLCGKPEALLQTIPRSSLRKELKPGSHIFEFKLKIPTEHQLPPTVTTQHGDVEYHLTVYKRLADGYEKVEERPLKFYGYNEIPANPGHQKVEFSHKVSEKGVSVMLESQKKYYLRAEQVPFAVQVKKGDIDIQISSVAVNLMRFIKFKSSTSVEIIEKVLFKKPSKREEFCVRSVFKKFKELPSYKSEKNGMEIRYSIQCEVTTSDQENGIITEELELFIGTTRQLPEEQEPTAIATQDNPTSSLRMGLSCMSLASSTLSMFPPAYSQLSSRSGSIVSLESLPPHYDDLYQADSPEDDKESEENN